MRTTVRMNDRILKEAKKLAAERGISLTRLIEEALQEKLLRSEGKPTGKQVAWVTVKGSGLQPGVDLDDSASLLDSMDDIHGSL